MPFPWTAAFTTPDFNQAEVKKNNDPGGVRSNHAQRQLDEIRNHQNDLDREDAVKRSLCIHNLDGTPYKIPEGHWFPGSMIPDFTNPETCKTWFGKRQYLLDMGVDGFKTDGGEFVCTDEVSFYDGSTGKESRNCYPQQYTKAYTKFLGDNHVLFSRAGYMGQHTTPCHWGGDQQSTNDELRHVLSAGLSAALSGILFWGFDLAGFAGPLPTWISIAVQRCWRVLRQLCNGILNPMAVSSKN